MPKGPILPVIFVGLGLAIILTKPFAQIGQSIGPGWDDILNGGSALALILIAGIAALVSRRSRV